ncbi:hypothetical protein KCU71_g7504, partial [Aureobasidium melanogenum]
MDGHTRRMILRLQKEDLTVLAALWNASAEDSSEYNATVRVYRRQLSLMDHYLSDARQVETTEDAAGDTSNEAGAYSRQSTDDNSPILTEFGDVHRLGGVYAPCGEPSLFTPTASPPPNVNATTAGSFVENPEHLVVRLPQPVPTSREQFDRLLREQFRPAPSCAQSEDILVNDVSDAHHQEKVEQLMAIVPGRAVSVIHKALQICYGRLDDALDYIFRQEENNVDMEIFDLSSSAATSEPATCNPALQSINHSTTTTTLLERSVDDLTILSDPPLKTQASAVNKKELEPESGSFVRKDTMEKMAENLPRSSRPLSSPTLRARNAELDGALCDIPPKYEMPKPTPRFHTTHQGFTDSMSMTPDSYHDMMRLNNDQHSQRNNGHGGHHQQGGCSQQVPQVISAPSSLDIHALSLMSPASQKQMLGQALYPKIHKQQFKFAGLYPKVRAQQPELVGKVTGMLLKLDSAEVLHLIKDDAALIDKVDEAMRVLDRSLAKNAGVSS